MNVSELLTSGGRLLGTLVATGGSSSMAQRVNDKTEQRAASDRTEAVVLTPRLAAAAEAAAQSAASVGPAQPNVSIRFRREADSGQMTIYIVDVDTEEVIRTVPPEELVRMGYDRTLDMFT